MFQRWFFCLLSLAALLSSARADEGPKVPLSGSVLERGTREPVPGVHVGLSAGAGKGTAGTADTDGQGRFAFAGLEPGAIKVRLEGARIVPVVSTEVLRSGRRTQVTYYVTVKRNPFQVVVRASAVRKEVVEQVLDAEEVKRIAGNQNDTIKAVQNLPGVARSAFGAGLLIVWGSSPADTRVYADGVSIPRIYHYGGLRATINADFVSQVAFLPGAYGADYGRGIGGVVELTTRSPRADRLHGSVTLDLIDGSVTLEGPITDRLHVALGARVSWISVFLPIVSRGANQILPFYYDYQLAAHYRASSRDDLDLLIFGATDRTSVKLQNADPTSLPAIDTRQYFSRARLRWTHRFSPDTVLSVTPSVGGDSFSVDTGLSPTTPLQVYVKQYSYNLRAELLHRFHRFVDTATGLDFEGQYTDANVLAPFGQPGQQVEGAGFPSNDMVRDLAGAAGAYLGNGIFSDGNPEVVRELSAVQLIQAAPYFITRFEFCHRRLLLSPQLRLAIDGIRSGAGAEARTLFHLEPRLLVRGEVKKGLLWLKLGLGTYHQPPGPATLTQRFGNPALDLQQATTYVAGFDLDPLGPGGGLHIEAQGFYKDLQQLVVPDDVTLYSNAGVGRVYGGELLLRQQPWRNLFGWVAYTLSRSERRDGPGLPWQLFRYDQTHILTLVAGTKLPWGLEAGIRFRYVTGSPTTKVIGGVRDASDQFYDPIQGPPYSARLPDFHQLDVRIDKTFTFNRWKLGLFLDIQNLYNQHNIESVSYGGRQNYQAGGFTGLPFFPDLGARADF